MTYVKFGVIALIVLVLFAGGYYLGGLKPKADLATYKETEATQLATAAEAAQAAQAAKAAAYEQEIDRLKAGTVRYPVVPVRLCPSAPHPRVPKTNLGGQVLSASAGALPPSAVGDPQPDLGPDLFALADSADEIVAKCRSN